MEEIYYVYHIFRPEDEGQYVESVKVDGKYKSVRRKYSENTHKVNPYPNWGMEKVKGTA